MEHRRDVLVSKYVSLIVAFALVVMLVYALVKFFEMIRVRNLDILPLFFVPLGIAGVILVILLRVILPLIRAVRSRNSRS